ncbi:AAA family ATPase [Microbacterium sp. NPDC077663]|uniref:AAA family ATPase n=1 Tax=Microbacterium sp. NPDC077663 TaxID=3364189 RepID=UPI0037C93112
MVNSDMFDEELELPNARAQRRYDSLVGLDEVKHALVQNAAVLLDPDSLRAWSEEQHGVVLPVVSAFAQRTPLFVFAGDVGTGKSTLAESFAQQIAVQHEIEITVLRLSLRARGTGAVGEMTKLLGEAFDEVVSRGRRMPKGHALVLVIDEADAIAQSRELGQMHHEDRAGVNALIRGIDTVAVEGLPILVVMCTNRVSALDPAVRRRAASEFQFERPNDIQRAALFTTALDGAGVTEPEIQQIAQAAGDDGRGYGHTYSDIVNRVLPAAVLSSYPSMALDAGSVMAAISAHPPTPPFTEK